MGSTTYQWLTSSTASWIYTRKVQHPHLQDYTLICKGEILYCRSEIEAAGFLGLAGECWSAPGQPASAACLPAKRGCYDAVNNAWGELSGKQTLLLLMQISLKQTWVSGILTIQSQKRCLWTRNFRRLVARIEIKCSFLDWPRQFLVQNDILSSPTLAKPSSNVGFCLKTNPQTYD